MKIIDKIRRKIAGELEQEILEDAMWIKKCNVQYEGQVKSLIKEKDMLARLAAERLELLTWHACPPANPRFNYECPICSHLEAMGAHSEHRG